MNKFYQEIKRELIEQASQRMVKDLQEDVEWRRQDALYGEYLEELGQRLKDEEFFMEFESVANRRNAYEDDYLYWRGILDGVALLKFLQVF